ncbi:MAG: hypothetical protein ACK5Z5_05050 [Neisseriaceae bacterium]
MIKYILSTGFYVIFKIGVSKMDYATLLLSKYAKLAQTDISYDVVQYKNMYYCGKNLFKNFTNYLSGDKSINVKKFSNIYDVNTHFDNVVI